MPRRKKIKPYPKFAVLGAGHGGLAMAGHLACKGYHVNLYTRNKERIDGVLARGGITVEGAVEGFGRLQVATNNIKDAIEGVDVIMVVVPASGHKFMAESMAPYLKDGQIIVLNPGRTLGSVEVAHIFKQKNVSADVLIAETQTFIYVSRHLDFARARIFEIKNSVPLAALPAYRSPDVLKVLRKVFPQFIPGTNVLQTSLDNIGAIFHPAITILNAARVEDERIDFEFYLEGVTQSVSHILEKIDDERMKVGAALGIYLHTAREWLYLAYDSPGKTLYDAIIATPAYKGVKAPSTLYHRYIFEDVPFSLVPIASLGDLVKVPTQTIKTLIHLASILHKVDYWKEGRTVEKVGLQGYTIKDLRRLVVG